MAGTWCVATHLLVDGTPGALVSTLPAILIAALVPTYLLHKERNRAVEHTKQPLSQRLEVLDRHVIVNVVNNRHCLTEVNEEFEKATGYTREEILGKPVSMFYFDSEARIDADTIRKGLIQGKTWQGETALRRKDGSLLLTHATIIPLFNPDGSWAGSISARTDVTRVNQLMAEQETVEALDELRDDVWIVDVESERFSYLNKTAMERMGWDRSEVAERCISDLNDPDAAAEIIGACRALAAAGEDLIRWETTFMGVPFEVSIKYLRVGNKKPRYLIMLNDISDRQQEERKKSEFIAMVSHELRSPLTSIKGSMGLMLSGAAGEVPQKALGLLEIAHRNADRLVLIINDILDLEKIAAGQLEFELRKVEMSTLVAEANIATAMLRNRFSLDVRTIQIGYPSAIETDPNRIIQVLTNLLSNACKFSRPNGRIEVKIEDLANDLRVSVRDQGEGIPKAEQHKIFEKFADFGNSNRAAQGGTGLGLSICKAIVEGLGGSIGFESEEGVGTTFHFVLPKKHVPALARPIEVEASPIQRAS
ncbi:MAG: PAS domain-containing sensor histidine kinase [Sulfitobacter sp.]|nr:PAS domain-containing sensor histidine kinase [Sulfitobacter sp.]